MAKMELRVPDIGDFKEVEVIEVLVKPGDVVVADQSLVTVESDKASMEIPASAGGVVVEWLVKVGDKIGEGSLLGSVEAAGLAAGATGGGGASTGSAGDAGLAAGATGGGGASTEQSTVSSSATTTVSSVSKAEGVTSVGGEAVVSSAETRSASPEVRGEARAASGATASAGTGQLPHASPSVRKFARELGVDLSRIEGSGLKGRITPEDVRAHVKGVMSGATTSASAGPVAGGAGLDLLAWPKVDFEKFGPVERKPLSRIKKISGANLHRNWVMIPHVTADEEADITDLEGLRVALNKEHEKSGTKITMLAFLIKVVVAALKRYPELNASLEGDNLVLKQYFHIGFAADTPNGLVVPVIRDADKKGVLQIAAETSELARRARDGKLSPSDMQGGCFSISSLGGIGGTHFTPLINAPEVAILGVSKSVMKPVWDGKAFVPRLILPLSLSYDHRVIDGASGARFNVALAQMLGDFRRVSL
jgi:pyruvate dehydrogenase E2 component (dihydrolipoamide acetyltransferase)